MYADFTAEFRNICGHSWKIILETCLHCSDKAVKQLSEVADHWIIDIKAMDPLAYKRYTGKASGVLQQLTLLQKNVPPKKVTIKVPQIPGFTDGRDLGLNTKDIERRFNFTDIVKARYRTNNRENIRKSGLCFTVHSGEINPDALIFADGACRGPKGLLLPLSPPLCPEL